MKNADTSSLSALGGSLFVMVILFFSIELGHLIVKHRDNKLLASRTSVSVVPATNMPAVKTIVATNNPVMVHGEKKEEAGEEMLAVCNTNVPKAVFTADKNKMKKHLQKKLAEEQSKNVN